MFLFSDASRRVEDPWLREAYRLAERGRGRTSPNPVVGCVVVKDATIIGRGFHEVAGGPHAEVVALREAGEAARGSHVAVTLEPCNHRGRTPPCTEALLDAGVASVTIGMRDPNPGVTGGGADRLRAAGVRVSFADDASPFEEQNMEWVHWLSTGAPWVRVKLAVSLDGRVSLRPAERTVITGRGGRRVTMRLRAASDAVVVGANTLKVDRPSLTVRDDSGTLAQHQPCRVVLSQVTVPDADSPLFSDGAGPVKVLLSDAVPLDGASQIHATGAEVLAYPASAGLAGAMEALGRDGHVSVLVEPGPNLFSALWDADLIDELFVVTAGGIAGASAPGVYPFEHEAAGDELERRMMPVEAGVSSESAVSVWRRAR
ncbi:MAG: bifunctional diaminohydroxyphosphoribosylaminopyrimidine deaminase/5-amino-6-(5-phosphoribosylamino)uracil reductase RibD [Coriobacteriia bacterium]